MKSTLLSISLLFMIFFVYGCAGNDTNEEAIEDDFNEQEELQEIEEENEVNEDEESNEEEEVEVEVVVEEDEIEIVQEPLYEMDSIFSVVPIDDTLTDENVVLLTIDDVFLSTNNNYALEMAQILNDLDAKAIFFINGQLLSSEEAYETLREIHELGFEIGNHTMNHPNLSDLSPEDQRSQIVDLNDLIEEITGERPRFFRAPYGNNTDVSKEVIEEEGMQWMNWTYGYDWEKGYMEAGPLSEIMVETPYLRNGANLLMHDRDFTRDALEDIVNGLREKGYNIVDPALIK